MTESKQDILLNYIGQRTGIISAKVQQEAKQLRALSSFFQSLRKETERYCSGIHKAITPLKTALNASNRWTEALNILALHETEVISSLQKYSQMLGSAIVQPLEEFVNRYESGNRKVLGEASKVLELTNAQIANVNKAKARYIKEGKAAKNSNNDAVHKSKIKQMEEHKKEYKDLLTNFNKTVDISKAKYIKSLEAWNSSEEAKLIQVRQVFSSLEELIKDVESVWTASRSSYEKMLSSVAGSFRLEGYIPKSSEICLLFDKLGFEVPEELETEEHLAKLFPSGVKEEDILFIRKQISNLLKGNPTPEKEKLRLVNLAKTKEGHFELCKSFALIPAKIDLENPAAFAELSELAKLTLDKLEEEKAPEPGYVAAVLNLGGLVSCAQESIEMQKPKYYIRATLIEHPIWRRKGIWDGIAEYKIFKSIEFLEASMNAERAAEGAKKGKVEFDREDAARRTIYIKELSYVSSEMAFYSIDSDVSREVMVKYAKMGDLSFEKLYQIVSDYEAAQPIPRDENPRQMDFVRCSLAKREKERKRYGFSRQSMILGMSMKFMGDIKTLISILCICKEWASVFKKKVYRHILRLTPDKTRLIIWKRILCTEGFNDLYPKMKEKILSDFTENSKSLEEIIRLDVMRSFYNYPEADREAMMRILRAYAILNPDVEYCQGMNCIAGFFYLLYKEEDTAFNMMYTLIYNFDLNSMFKLDVPLLRVYFYQLNRLMAVYVPRLHAHLFEEGINATYFASPWFLTIFTHTLQSSDTPTIPPLLLLIFDEFLTKGAKSLLRTSLFILEHFEEKLLGSPYEVIMQFMTQLPKSGFFFKSEVAEEYKARIRDYNITDELLTRLNDEYSTICTIADKKENVPHTPMTPFKHYISYHNTPKKHKFVSVYFPN
eukprot:TRINITY_DN9799_c0_g6_i2.p1 TRINITY_DN9799_c0_g6~~TRINITY_DN9799_c0_g6_i2.p1  ORF type:complete len:890 (+),score=228.66 TRINITY_DN9799_c0_g6_i2:175-2844(+)